MYGVEKGRGGKEEVSLWSDTDVQGCENRRVRQAKKRTGGGGPCTRRALLAMGQWVQRPSAGAAGPLHGHVHQAPGLDAPRDVPFAGLLPLSSASRAWQGGGLQPDVVWEEGWAPRRCRGISKQQSHLCTLK